MMLSPHPDLGFWCGVAWAVALSLPMWAALGTVLQAVLP